MQFKFFMWITVYERTFDIKLKYTKIHYQDDWNILSWNGYGNHNVQKPGLS